MLLLLLLNNWRPAHDGHPERSGVRAGGTEEQTDHTPQTVMNARAPVVLEFSTEDGEAISKNTVLFSLLELFCPIFFYHFYSAINYCSPFLTQGHLKGHRNLGKGGHI